MAFVINLNIMKNTVKWILISGLFVFCFSGCRHAIEKRIHTISIVAVGDINFGSDYPINKTPDKNQRKLLFRHCEDIIKNADIAFCNLETVLCRNGVPAKNINGKNTFVFRADPYFCDVLVDAGFDVVSITNNHIRDFGTYGESQTKKILTQSGIQFVSIDGDIAEFVVSGVKICFVGFTSGLRNRSIVNPSVVFHEIKKLSEKYDILVVSFHAGAEGDSAIHTKNTTEIFLGENRGNPVLLAHGAIDNGADLVLMHGPHVPRAVEMYKDRFIAYSLGNFVNYGWNLSKFSKIAPLLWIELFSDGRACKVHIVSFIQRKSGFPEFDTGNSTYTIIKKLTESDFESGNIKFTNREE